MAIEAMKIYLDNCALQRPLDDKSQMRIRLEAEAVLSVLELCKAGELDLISSEALELEEERRELFADQTLDDLINEIKQRRTRRTGKQFTKAKTTEGI